MAKYQKYAEYKDSGVEWLGEIPIHWDLFALKRSIDKCTNGFWGAEPDGINDLCVLRVADFDRDNFKINLDKLTYRSVLPKEAESRLLKKGDLLIEKSGGGEKTLVGCVVQFDKDFPAITSNFVAKMTPNSNMDSRFLTYSFAHLYSGRVNYPAIKQTTGIQNLDSEAYLMENFCFPSKMEQIKIANFLDYETAKIDSLIEKQQQLIELLKEKRQAVISHAVTKGLDPRVKMKDSGVEWLGEVPEHWNTLPLKLCVQTRKGVAFKAVDFCDAGIRVVKASDIKQKTIRESETFLPNSYVNEFPKAVLHTDDLILSTVGSTPDVKNSAVGQIGKVPQSLSGSLLNQNTVVFSSTEILDQNFLYYLVQTNSYRDHLDLNAHGTANQASLNISDMLNFMISIPELNEQVEIKNYLDKKISKVEELELKILAMSISLNERRTALISAAVTGKIDVRNWQNPTEAKMEFSA